MQRRLFFFSRMYVFAEKAKEETMLLSRQGSVGPFNTDISNQ